MQKLRNQLRMMASPHVIHCSHDRGQPRVNLASNMHTRTRQPSHLLPSHNKTAGVGGNGQTRKQTVMCLSRAFWSYNVLVRTSVGIHLLTGSHSPWWHQHVERTWTFHSNCWANETKTEPHVVHLRAARDKCLIRQNQTSCMFCSSNGEVRNTIRR